MSTNNLLLSLLANNPSSRSNSLASKHGLSPSLSLMSRSTSVSLGKKLPSNVQKSSQLIKVTHLLNVKVKQYYYFVFCKLEQASKIIKNNHSASGNQSSTIGKLNNTGGQKQQKCSVKLDPINKIQSMRKGLQAICDFYITVSTKIQTREKGSSLLSGFRGICRLSSKISSANKILKCINTKIHHRYQSGFSVFAELQKMKIKTQILVGSLAQIFSKSIHPIFNKLKSFQPFQKQASTVSTSVLEQSSAHHVKGQYSQFLLDQSSITDRSQTHSQIVYSQVSYMNKVKKIKLKQKKLVICKAIKLDPFLKVTKPNKITLSQQIPFSASYQMFENKSEYMSKLMNIKQQNIINTLPDFIDHCSIFSELPQLSDFVFNKRIVSEQSQLHLPKTQTQGCLTERTKKKIVIKSHHQTQKQTPSKHKSLGTSKSFKKISIKDETIVPKAQQLLQSVRQLTRKASSNTHKKLVSIDLPKATFESANRTPVNVSFTKFPMKQQRPDIANYKSQQKYRRNKPEKPIPDQVKPKANKFNSEEGQNYKSTTITRQKKMKPDKGQLFTARKMKMQIQNIINRRNKDLGYEVR